MERARWGFLCPGILRILRGKSLLIFSIEELMVLGLSGSSYKGHWKKKFIPVEMGVVQGCFPVNGMVWFRFSVSRLTFGSMVSVLRSTQITYSGNRWTETVFFICSFFLSSNLTWDIYISAWLCSNLLAYEPIPCVRENLNRKIFQKPTSGHQGNPATNSVNPERAAEGSQILCLII